MVLYGVWVVGTKIEVYVVRPAPPYWCSPLACAGHALRVMTNRTVLRERAPAGLEGSRRSLWRGSLRPTVLFVLSRVGVMSVVAAASVSAHHSVMSQLLGWDTKWYLMVAQHGYVHAVPPGSGNVAQSDLGFFPLLPILIRAVHFITGFGFGVAGVITSNLLGLLGAIAAWWLLRDVFGEPGADQGTALILLSPAAFVLSMVYSEGAIILFVASSLLALRHRYWIVAGLCAAVATAADPVASAAIVPCVVAAFVAVRSRREWRALWAPLLAPLGIGLFFLYLWAHTGSPFSWFNAQRAGWQGGTFGAGIPTAVGHVLLHGFHNLNADVKTISTLVAIALLIYFWRARVPAPWVAYVVAVLVLGIASPIIGITPRLLLRDFVLLGVVGASLSRRQFEVVIVVSVFALATLTVVSGTPFWTP